MKIAFTTDTHLVQSHEGSTTIGQINQLSEDMHKENPDLIVHGGDVGEVRIDVDNFSQVLNILGEGAIIIGNHDLWTNPPISTHTSWDLWNDLLPRICEEKGWHYLERSNLVQDGVAVVGSYLHYNYSSADPEGTAVNHIRASFPDWTPDEYYERMKKRVVNDAKFFTGMPRDKEFAAQIGVGFERRLLEAEADPEIHTIVIVTHVPCMPCQITRKPWEWHWSCATAYFGNLSSVEVIMSCSKVKCVLSGHSHQDNHNIVEFADEHQAQVITLGADYADPKFLVVNV